MYKIIVIIRFHWIAFNNTSAAGSAVMPAVVFYYHCMWTFEQSAVTAVPRPGPGCSTDKCWRQLQCVAAGRHRAPGSLASHCPGLSCRACAHPALYITWAGGATGHPPELCTLCVAPWPSSWSLLLLMEHAHACNPALSWQAVTQNCHGVKWYNELDS